MISLSGAIVTLIFSVAFYAAGEYFSKLWGLTPNLSLLSLALGCYICASLLWFPALLYRDQLSTVGITWEVLGICATLALGFFVFHEVLSPKNWLGLGFALIAVWLLLT